MGSWLGYGEADAVTLLDNGDNATSRRAAAFFQHSFEASKIDHLEKLKLRLRFDDGVAVYLNGTEIARANLDPSPTYNSYSTDKVSGIDESRYQVFIVDDSLLVEGTNLLSAQVHQDSPTSSDIIFDLALEALLP